MAAALVGGAALGAVFGELLKAVLEIKDKAIMFKPTLAYLQSSLEAIAPVVTEIEQHNNDLGRPKEELESLIRKMQEGTNLVYKCSNIHRFNYVARVRYQERLVSVVHSIEKFCNIDMQAQAARDQKETLLKVRRILSAVSKIPLVNREDTRTSFSDSSEQVTEPITGTKQDAGQVTDGYDRDDDNKEVDNNVEGWLTLECPGVKDKDSGGGHSGITGTKQDAGQVTDGYDRDDDNKEVDNNVEGWLTLGCPGVKDKDSGGGHSGIGNSSNSRLCRNCGKEESCVLILPCRHLCLCTICESILNICPICKYLKNASVHINMS